MNIGEIRNCFGCGVCATVCTQHIIDIVLNDDGFYEPRITNNTKCTNCGVCVDICAYSHDDIALKDICIQSYGAWSKDEAIRRKCSSGGIGFELGRTLISEGYKVCGVRFNAEQNRAEHYIATTVEELIPSIGSKYIQSYTVDGFKAIDRKQKYLVTGTPCQIDSFRRYIQKFHCEDNFVLMDFFCHGVPSKLMWDKYVKWAESKVGKLTYVSWRNKFTGWHDSYAISIKGQKGFLNSRFSQGDMFYCLFLSDTCLGKVCYEKCKYKYDKSSADIRIGDAWGSMFRNENKGVSSVVAFTTKGKEKLNLCNCELKELPLDVVTEYQMKTNPIAPSYTENIWLSLRKPSECLYKAAKYPIKEIRRNKWKRRINHLLRIIKISYQIK